jgi:Holliday junction resolvase-like predicted endonuclease
MKKLGQWQVATAAEAFAAAQFARCGWDVSVQYGANQPEYDLVAVSGDHMLKVSVKGSQDGGWGLTQSHIKDANYHRAADLWLEKHSKKTVFCLVQFQGVALNQLPRMYLATPSEIAAWLKAAASGRGDTILYEKHVWSARAQAGGTTDTIPAEWVFTAERTKELAALAQPTVQPDVPAAASRRQKRGLT